MKKFSIHLFQHLKGDIVLHVFVAISTATIAWLIDEHILKSKIINNLFKTDDIKLSFERWRYFIDAALAILVFIQIEVIVTFRKVFARAQIAYASGLFFFRHNATNRGIEKSKAFLTKASRNCSHIYILAVTGWNTFGKGSPLHETISNCAEIKILLCDPTCKEFKNRAHNMGIALNDFRKATCNSLDFLISLRSQHNTNIELKFYRKKPLWKYTLINNLAWVQQYPDDCSVKNSPCYAFENTKLRPERGYSIYSHIFNQFLTRWNNPFLGKYEFDDNQIVYRDTDGKVKHSEKFFNTVCPDFLSTERKSIQASIKQKTEASS